MTATLDTSSTYKGDRSGPVYTSTTFSRSVALDALRGAAVLLMLLDHVLIWQAWSGPLRLTVTRAAMPLFFVVGGHLAHRLSWRTAWIAVLGMALPGVAWWIDSPNVLLWFALMSVVIVGCKREVVFGRVVLAVCVAVPLVQLANFIAVSPTGQSYDPPALMGLMALGALLPRSAFAFADRAPRWLACCGCYPLTVYVSHVLAVTVAVDLWRSFHAG